MSEKRFKGIKIFGKKPNEIFIKDKENDYYIRTEDEVVDLLNEQQEFIEELQTSDEMGWKRAEHFEKKCPKELHNKKMYIKRLEYKVQKFKEENEKLRKQCFELEKDYVIETSDISDKIYLDDEIKELKQRYGVDDE